MRRMLRSALLLLLLLVLPAIARGATGPTTPTFFLAWGTNGSAAGQFSFPIGVATDGLGNVYVADRANNRIQKFDRLGHFVTQWGSNGTGNGQFNNPTGVAADPSGNIYVADYSNNRQLVPALGRRPPCDRPQRGPASESRSLFRAPHAGNE